MNKKPKNSALALQSIYEEWERRKKEQIKDPDVFTTKEICEKTGLSNKKALVFIKYLIVKDVAEAVFTTRKDMWGRPQPSIPAVRINTEEADELLQGRLS
jgi:hypothetical protein